MLQFAKHGLRSVETMDARHLWARIPSHMCSKTIHNVTFDSSELWENSIISFMLFYASIRETWVWDPWKPWTPDTYEREFLHITAMYSKRILDVSFDSSEFCEKTAYASIRVLRKNRSSASPLVIVEKSTCETCSKLELLSKWLQMRLCFHTHRGIPIIILFQRNFMFLDIWIIHKIGNVLALRRSFCHQPN